MPRHYKSETAQRGASNIIWSRREPRKERAQGGPSIGRPHSVLGSADARQWDLPQKRKRDRGPRAFPRVSFPIRRALTSERRTRAGRSTRARRPRTWVRAGPAAPSARASLPFAGRRSRPFRICDLAMHAEANDVRHFEARVNNTRMDARSVYSPFVIIVAHDADCSHTRMPGAA
jgi:hypothetical protein